MISCDIYTQVSDSYEMVLCKRAEPGTEPVQLWSAKKGNFTMHGIYNLKSVPNKPLDFGNLISIIF